MNELEFARAYLGEFSIKGAEIVPKLCPYCRGGQHGDKDTFALNMDKHTFKCLRGSCGQQGHFSELCRKFGVRYEDGAREIATPKVVRPYKRPDAPRVALDGAEWDYIAKRKITRETARAFGVGGARGEVVFPYYETPAQFAENAPVFVKYRPARRLEPGEGKARRAKDAKPVLFGMHLCDPAKEQLTIFEGEFDCLAGHQAGGVNCVSVPSGCKDFSWLETCADFLGQFSRVLVMADHDEPGMEMLRELSRKLECPVYRPDFEKYRGCKDANELLFRHDADALKAAMDSARPQETLGLLNLADIEPVDYAHMPRVLSGIPTLDRITGGLYEGDLDVWTGKRGEGKSTILTQLLLEAVEQGYNVCAYSGEMPKERFKYGVCVQAAGTEFVRDFEDSLSGRVTQYVPKDKLQQINRWFDGRFWLYDNQIVETDEAESVIRVFEQAYRRYNCKVFLVDNLMCIRSCRRYQDFYQMQADFAVRLRKLAQKLGVLIHLVVHPRKTPKGVTDNDDVGGLSTITDIACNVFSLKRVREEDKADYDGADAALTCMKNRAYGEMGEIKLDFAPRPRRYVECGRQEKIFSWAADKDGFIELGSMDEPPF